VHLGFDGMLQPQLRGDYGQRRRASIENDFDGRPVDSEQQTQEYLSRPGGQSRDGFCRNNRGEIPHAGNANENA
jgi:hypothetical protein